ncbi:MAG: DALR domain-containing protein, partial [Scytonema sp. PMC 1069.18]|nr:DALR domain-containing protein [Scytonema sp. PMC 1069.18]
PYIERFTEAVNDDFNFAAGLVVLFELAKELQREGHILVHEGKIETSPDELKQQWQTLVTLAEVLGFETHEEGKSVSTDSLIEGVSDAEIEVLIQKRQEARKTKNFAEADRIRNELQAQGITLIDSRDGTRWHRS